MSTPTAQEWILKVNLINKYIVTQPLQRRGQQADNKLLSEVGSYHNASL